MIESLAAWGEVNLNIKGDNIREDQAKFLANELKNNTSITVLDLSMNVGNGVASNSIKIDGAKWIAEMLKRNQSLMVLKLSILFVLL